MKARQLTRFGRATRQSGRGGFVLTATLAGLAAAAFLLPTTTPEATASTNGAAWAIPGTVNVPQGFPASSKRFTPSGKALRYRTFYSKKGAETWDGWTSAASAKEAQGDANKLLSASDHYTHAFIEDGQSGKVVWSSWER